MTNKTWRIKSGDGTTSEAVEAPDIKSAMRLLGTRNVSHIQVIENGSWVWAVWR